MSTLRFHSLKASMDRDPIIVNDDLTRSSIFGTNVFSLAVMQTYLSKSTYERLIFSVERIKQLIEILQIKLHQQ